MLFRGFGVRRILNPLEIPRHLFSWDLATFRLRRSVTTFWSGRHFRHVIVETFQVGIVDRLHLTIDDLCHGQSFSATFVNRAVFTHSIRSTSPLRTFRLLAADET